MSTAPLAKPVYQGSTESCFRHYLGTLPKGSVPARLPMIRFIGVAATTAQTWINSGVSPHGLNLLKLRVFLSFLGYDLEELKKLDARIIQATEFLALGVLSIEDILKDTGATALAILDVCLGRLQRNDLIPKLDKIYSLFKAEIEQKKAEAIKSLEPEYVRITPLMNKQAPPANATRISLQASAQQTKIKGNVRECFYHYLDSLPKHDVAARKPIMDFIGAHESTLRYWVSRTKFPHGNYLMKAIQFLKRQGYEITTTVQQPAPNPIQAGISQNHAIDSALRAGATTQSSQAISLPKRAIDSKTAPVDSSDIVSLAHTIIALGTMMNKVLPQATDEQLQEIRAIVGKDEIFIASNALNALCSKDAHKLWKNNE